MQLQIWLSLALTGLTVAISPVEAVRDIYARSEQDFASTQDAAALKKLLNSINPAVVSLHTTIKGLTAENAGSEMKTLNTKAHTVAQLLESGAAALEKSPPLKGITDALGLISPGRTAMTTVNQTLQDLFAKKEIIKNSGQIPLFEEGLRSLKPGTLALGKAMQSQIPESMKSQIPKGTAIPNDEKIGQLLDGLFDQVIAVMKGEQEKVTVPASLATLIPAKGAGGLPGGADLGGAPAVAPTPTGGMGGMPGMGGLPKVSKGSTPKATGIPKLGGGFPKSGSGTPKLGGGFPKNPKGSSNGMYVETWA